MNAIIKADTTIKTAFIPKNQKSSTVIGRFAQGDARKNATIADVLAPLWYNSIPIANMPWQHAVIRKPNIIA